MTIEQRLHDALQAEDRSRAPALPGDVDALIGRGRRRALVTRSASALAGVLVLAGAGVGVSRMAERPPAPVIGSEAPSTAPSPTVAPTTDPSPAPTGSETSRDRPSDGVDTAGPITAADLGPAIGLDSVLHRIDADGTRTDLWENIAFRIDAFAADPSGPGAFVGTSGQNDPPSTRIGRVGPDGEFEELLAAEGDRHVTLLDAGTGPDGATLLVYAVSGPLDGSEHDQLWVRDVDTGEDRMLWSIEASEGAITHGDLEDGRIAYIHDDEGFTTAHVVDLAGEQLLDPIGRFGEAGPEDPEYVAIALDGDRLVTVERAAGPDLRREVVVRSLDGGDEVRRELPRLSQPDPLALRGITARDGQGLLVAGPRGMEMSYLLDLPDGRMTAVDDPGAFRLVD